MIGAEGSRLLPEKISRGLQGQNREVRSPTYEMLDAAAKHLGAQSIFLGAPGYLASHEDVLRGS